MFYVCVVINKHQNLMKSTRIRLQLLIRLPVEMSCGVQSLLPYHTATASALLTSMLSVSRHSYGWTPEGINSLLPDYYLSVVTILCLFDCFSLQMKQLVLHMLNFFICCALDCEIK